MTQIVTKCAVLCIVNLKLRTMTKNNLLVALANLYSEIMGETISARTTAYLLHAQTALTSVILPIDMPIALRLATLCWAGAALFLCSGNVGKR